MNAKEVASIIGTIIQSLKTNPTQFHFTVNINASGVSGVAQNGGVGVMGVSHGGGTGIYSKVSVDNAEIEILQNKANDKINKHIKDLIENLSLIEQEIKSSSPDKSKLSKFYESLKNIWCPGVITSVVGNLISSLII